MPPSTATPARRVEQFFQISLVLLLANGFFAILFTGRLDAPTAILIAAALVARLLLVLDVIRFVLPKWLITLLSIGYLIFFSIDYLLITRAFVPATVRMMFFFTGLRLLSAKSGRDYFYLGLLAFLHLLTVSMFLPGVGYLGVLLLFLVLATTTIVSFEVKRGCESGARLVDDLDSKPPRSLVARLAAASAAMSVAMLALSVCLFLVLPRVIGRPPLSPLRFDPMIGFSQEVDLGVTGTLRPSHSAVMRIEGIEGDVSQLRWRGLALWHFDGRRWSSPAPRPQLIGTDRYATPRRWHSRESRRIHYRVMLEPLASQALFVAGIPERIVSGSFDQLVFDETDSLRVLDAGMRPIQYEVLSWLTERNSQRPADVSEFFDARFHHLYLQLPELDPRIAKLAQQVTASKTTDLGRAEALEAYLRNDFGYTLTLPERHPDPLAYFLFERRAGHCEYFASAMTVMLRTLGISARLVNGFAGGVDNPITGRHVIRSRDAHSWVEAYIPGYGWLEFDPTPADPNADMKPWTAELWMYWDAVQSGWSDWVVEYDFSHQLQLARAVQGRTRDAASHFVNRFEEHISQASAFFERLTAFSGQAPSTRSRLWLMALAAALVLLAGAAGPIRRCFPWLLSYLHARRIRAGQGRPSDCTFFYRRALKILARRGVVRESWETPDEFSRSAASAEIAGLLDQITASYNAARYGRDRDAELRLPRLVQALERTRI